MTYARFDVGQRKCDVDLAAVPVKGSHHGGYGRSLLNCAAVEGKVHDGTDGFTRSQLTPTPRVERARPCGRHAGQGDRDIADLERPHSEVVKVQADGEPTFPLVH